MLKFTHINHPEILKKRIKQFNPSLETWIVSDLKSKQDIQNQCIKQQGYYQDDSILRISDFWRIWLRRLAPQINVVNDEFLNQEIELFLTQNKESLGIESYQASTVKKYIEELASVLLNKGHFEVVKEWAFNDGKTWSKWLLVSKLCMDYLVQSRRVISAKWIAALLQNLDLEKIQWKQKIILDLGSEMTAIEFGNFQVISKKIDIEILVPTPIWKNRYKYLLHTYELNQGYAQVSAASDEYVKTELDSSKYARFQTESHEIKYIVGQVRKWLDEGVKPENIALLSPRLEDYWPVLKMHLDYEGIPYNKKVVSPLITVLPIQTILSKLLTRSHQATWESLEQGTFHENEKNNVSRLSYEKFKSLFVELIDSEDLLREESIRKYFHQQIKTHEKMTREEFVTEIFKILIEYKDSEIYEEHTLQAVKDFLGVTISANMNFNQWIAIFTQILRNKEITVSPSNLNGIDLRSIQNTALSDVTHIIWYGLDDSGFKTKQNHILSSEEMEYLRFNFDFTFSYSEETHTEFNLRWLSQMNFKEQYFTCALFSNKAEPLTSSLFMLEGNPKPDVDFSVEKNPTRLDQVLFSFNEASPKLQKEKNKGLNDKVQFFPEKVSSTEIVNYDQCGFKLLASKGFRLRDYAPTGLDLDPRQRGNLTHALFEYLIKDDKYKNVKTNEIEQFLDQKRIEFNLYPHADTFWLIQRSKYLELSSRFIAMETERLTGLNLSHLLEFDFKLNFEELTVTGRVDRIDVNPRGEALVYDYKNSNSDKTNFGVNWIDKKEYQLLFYLLAVENTLKSEADSSQHLKDVGAYYFFYKTMMVSKGLLNKDLSSVFQNTVPVNKSLATGETYEELKNNFKTIMLAIKERMKEGNYSAVPFNEKICSDCQWNQMCRAPHLT